MLIALLLATSAHAAFTPQSFVDTTNEAVADIAALAGLGADLHMHESTKPYGSTVGLDVGATATAVMIPGAACNALTALGIPNIPHYLPIPKVNIQKGLADKFIVGSEFIPTVKISGAKITSYGFDAQWLAIDRPRMPFIAIRGQFTYNDFAFVNSSTYGGDVLTSWKLPVFDIFGGAGYRFINAKISNPTSTIPTLPGVRLDATLDAGHFFAGATVAAGFARLTLQADLTTRGVDTYGTKLSFFF